MADELFDDLKRLRDELKLKMHLGSADAKSAWEELEGKWKLFEAEQIRPVSTEVARTATGVAAELKAGYERIKGLL